MSSTTMNNITHSFTIGDNQYVLDYRNMLFCHLELNASSVSTRVVLFFDEEKEYSSLYRDTFIFGSLLRLMR